MDNEKLTDLMHKELDGTISPKSKEELNHYLESDNEARQTMNKLRLIHSKLKEVEEVEPPAELKESVMRSLPAVRRITVKENQSVFSKIISVVEVPRFQMAGMFSLGMAAALILFAIAGDFTDSNSVSSDKVIGTIGAMWNADESEPIDSRLVYTDGSKADVKTFRYENRVIAEIDVDSPVSRTIQLFVTSKNAGELRFTAIEQSVPNLVFANFGFDYFSATVSGTGKIILVFEDQGNAQGPLQIELKTETSSAVETVEIQKVNL